MSALGSVLQAVGIAALLAGVIVLAGWEWALIVAGAALLTVRVLVEMGGRDAGPTSTS